MVPDSALGVGVMGEWFPDHHIYVVVWVVHDSVGHVVAHEILHDLLNGDINHQSPAWTRCGLWAGGGESSISSPLDRFFLRLHLNDREARNELLRLGERTIDDDALVAAELRARTGRAVWAHTGARTHAPTWDSVLAFEKRVGDGDRPGHPCVEYAHVTKRAVLCERMRDSLTRQQFADGQSFVRGKEVPERANVLPAYIGPGDVGWREL